jgi:hypothetical protein
MAAEHEDGLLERPEVPEDEEEEETSSQSESSQLAKKLEELTSSVRQDANSAVTLAKLVADPDIRRILEARQAGKKVKVLDGDEEPVRPVEPQKDLEEMTNQELMAHLATTLQGQVNAQIQKALEPVISQLGQVGQVMQSQKAKEVASEVNQVREKYEDFDDFKPDMLKLNQSNPDLSVEELYLIAKRRKGGPSVNSRTQTERPTSVSRTRVAGKPKPGVGMAGRNAFNSLLANALEHLPIPGMDD